MWMLQERRQQRTSEREEALRFQLEHSRARGGLEALVLADQQGMVVASAGETAICEELGAIAPLMLKTPDNPGGLPLQVFDAIRAGVAAGAVVITTEESLDPQQLREAVAAHLGLTGFDVVSAIPGWHHDTACLAPSY